MYKIQEWFLSEMLWTTVQYGGFFFLIKERIVTVFLRFQNLLTIIK